MLMVGGGGGGGQDTGSGGGGGAMLELQNVFVAAGSYDIKVGKGGEKAIQTFVRGADGGITQCSFLPSNKICYGGAGGASNNTGGQQHTPRDGGNGAGGQVSQNGIGRNFLASGTVIDRDQWFPFGNQAGAGSGTLTTGGGGGPGCPGRQAEGGHGRYSDITGSFVQYGGGGGGNLSTNAHNDPEVAGGDGGGGNAGGDGGSKHGSEGLGGGGGSWHGGWGVGGNGGSGIVILRIRN